MNSLKFIGIAIAAFMAFVVIAIGWSLLMPGNEQVLTEQYDLETMGRSKAYYGKNRPFLLSGTTLLWCNGSLVSFPSEVTVVNFNPSLDRNDIEVTICN